MSQPPINQPPINQPTTNQPGSSPPAPEVQRYLTSRTLTEELRLWFGTLGGGVMWLLHLIAAYVISEFGCASNWGHQSFFGLSLVFWLGITASALALVGTWWALRVARGNGRHYPLQDRERIGLDDGPAFMVRSGILSNQIFVFITAMQTLPFLFYLYGC